jgi:hypothetical protein
VSNNNHTRKGVPNSLKARLAKQRTPVKTHPPRNDTPDFFQKRSIFTPADKTANFHNCGTGHRRGTVMGI